MKDCTYYDLLGVPLDATEQEIIDAKNFLVKRLHPDANLTGGYDTTPLIQNVLFAYRILSNAEKRRIYDKRIRNFTRREQPNGTGSNGPTGPLSPNFAPYWESANKLNEFVRLGYSIIKKNKESQSFKSKLSNKLSGHKSDQEQDKLATLPDEVKKELASLAAECDIHMKLLESGKIPRNYWYSNAMNWLLFQWSQHRDYTYPMLFSLYDSYLEQKKSSSELKKIHHQESVFLETLETIMACQKV